LPVSLGSQFDPFVPRVPLWCHSACKATKKYCFELSLLYASLCALALITCDRSRSAGWATGSGYGKYDLSRRVERKTASSVCNRGCHKPARIQTSGFHVLHGAVRGPDSSARLRCCRPSVLSGHQYRLWALLREDDTLARLGGDEFVAVLHDFANTNESLPVVSGLLLQLTIGIADLEHGWMTKVLLRVADSTSFERLSWRTWIFMPWLARFSHSMPKGMFRLRLADCQSSMHSAAPYLRS